MPNVVRTSLALIATSVLFVASVSAADRTQKSPQVEKISGAELFAREWLPNDPRSHGGDGLGPVFNDSSCIACHNQAGAGGGGPKSKNVDIVSAFLNQGVQFRQPQRSIVSQAFRSVLGLPSGATKDLTKDKAAMQKQRDRLVKEAEKLHPGFLGSRSVVVHLFGTDDGYVNWRGSMLGNSRFGFNRFNQTMHIHDAEVHVSTTDVPLTVEIPTLNQIPTPKKSNKTDSDRMAKLRRANQQMQQHRVAVQQQLGQFGTRHHGSFTLTTTQRNATALFGAGLLDSISDEVIQAAAKKTFKEFPGVSGRVSRLPNGKIGRFGWKSQKSNLRDFAMTACAVELGLNVPEHPQSGLPSNPTYKPKGFDMNKAECDALVDYLSNLPAPTENKPRSDVEGKYVAEGKALFNHVGCAVCHAETMGEVVGIYSDMLLHDMGQDLGDTGDYGVFIPDSPGGEAEGVVPDLAELMKPRPVMQTTTVIRTSLPTKQQKEAESKILGATRTEWRTPALWGVRDSAPYLHDGRANNLQQAVALHGGEGTQSARKFFELSSKEQMKVIAFLKSLTAPTTLAAK